MGFSESGIVQFSFRQNAGRSKVQYVQIERSHLQTNNLQDVDNWKG
jgi:hypothetical protein